VSSAGEQLTSNRVDGYTAKEWRSHLPLFLHIAGIPYGLKKLILATHCVLPAGIFIGFYQSRSSLNQNSNTSIKFSNCYMRSFHRSRQYLYELKERYEYCIMLSSVTLSVAAFSSLKR
jgi:hypothetical protein